MGKASKALRDFINTIPASKLVDIPNQAGKLYSDDNFRLDMQGMTSDRPQRHNLQVQVNKQTTISTLKPVAPKTVSIYLADVGASADTVRQGLLDGMMI